MGSIAIRAYFKDAQRGMPLPERFFPDLFGLLHTGLEGSTVDEDIRIATRFHSEGIDIDLSSDHFLGSNDQGIVRLSVALGDFLARHKLPCQVTILRASDLVSITPISTITTS